MNIESERIKKYIQYFWQGHMQPHFQQEEEILFAPLNDEKVQKAIHEHRQIKEQVDAIAGGGQITTEQLSALADMVDNHVRYEERELFPHLETVLSTTQLEEIGRKIMDENQEQGVDEFGDEFWVKVNSAS